MNKKAFLICFTGMDGTGKTTQAKNLVNTLNANGINCSYVWNTYQPFITKPFLLFGKALFFCGKDAFKDYTEYNGIRIKLFKNPLLSWSYKHFSLFDYLCQSFKTISLPHLLGNNIVCDRYVQDVVVNLAVELDYSDDKAKGILNRLLRWLPKPNVTFLMDVPEEIGYKRKNDTPSIEHLGRRRRIYLNIGKEVGTVMLDGSVGIRELEDIIQDKVERALKSAT